MTEETRAALATAQTAATRLVGECRKGGPLYGRRPRAVAQVSRTGKWLLNALQRLNRELDQPEDNANA